MEYDIKHLKEYSEWAHGPIQADEALFLFALVRVVRPRVVVEFGFDKGKPAINFLKALDEEGVLFSFDYKEECEAIARSIQDDRFKFIVKKQQDFCAQDIDNREIDLLFIDASHRLNHNLKLFKKMRDSLKENALIIIHDTGTWNLDLLPKAFTPWSHHMEAMQKRDPSARVTHAEFAHQPEERMFVNRLRNLYPEFQQVHVHALHTIRHGLTILQKAQELPLGRRDIRSVFYHWLRRLLPRSAKVFLIKAAKRVAGKEVRS